MATLDEFTVHRTSGYSLQLAEEFQSLRDDDELVDFTLRTGPHAFPCHRLLLAANSPVLKAMLRCNMVEASRQEMRLDTIEGDVLKIILEYMYSGQVKVPMEMLMATLQAADYLQMLEIKQICASHAPAALTTYSAIYWIKMADKMNLRDLQTKCVKFLSSHFGEISKGQEFAELSGDEMRTYFTEICDSGVDPDELLDAALTWVHSETKTRTNMMQDLLQIVPLQKCSVQCLEEVLEKHLNLFCCKVHASDMLKKAMNETARKKRQKGVLAVVGGFDGQELNDLCWYQDSNASMAELCNIPASHCNTYSSVCSTPNGFAVTGGKYSDACTMFVAATKSWHPVKRLPVNRHSHGSHFVDGQLFVLGGYVSETQPSDSVHFLSMANLFPDDVINDDQWQEGPALSRNVIHPEVANIGDDLFLLDTDSNLFFQLEDAKKTNVEVETLDKATCDRRLSGVKKSWSTKASLPGARSRGARMEAVDGWLCVAGGDDQILAWYTPSTDSWATGTQPLLKHWLGALVYNDKKVFLLGGTNQDQVEEYDLQEDSWSVCELRLPRVVRNIQGLVLHIEG